MFDLVIKDAQIVDGIADVARRGDVAVRSGRIVEVGKVEGRAKRTVSADGLVLAPGIIDVHTHYDAQLTWDRTASPSPSLGVTTVVMGNCGFGIAPAPPVSRQLIARNLSEVEGMSLNALETGIDWGFESFADYFQMLRDKGSFPNVATLVGHSTVRSVVMGEEASERAASAAEITAMQKLVRQAMADGAIGFASSQSLNHNGYGGVPMPSRLAQQAEFDALVGVLGEVGRGIFQMTVGPVDNIEFLERLAAQSGRPVIFSALFHNEAFPARAENMLRQASAAQRRGNRVFAQVACQPLSMDFTLGNAYPLQSLEVWESLRDNDAATLREAFADSQFRSEFRAQLARPALGKLFYGNWQQMEVAQVTKPSNRSLEGQTVAAIAEQRGTDPIDVFFDLAIDEDLQSVFSAKLLNADDDQVEPLLKHEAGIISLSDAGAHLAYLCDAGFGVTLLSHWVRDRQAFTLSQAVRQLTKIPADLYGIQGRGCLVPGAFADLMLFDPDAIALSGLERVYDMPAGESRMIRRSQGIEGVWVNGEQVWDGTNYTNPPRAPGTILDSFAAG